MRILRGGLVDQVDRLVGQEAVGDVAVRERGGGDQRAVLDRDFVVHLVALLEPAQDRDRVLRRSARRRITGWKRRSSAASFSMYLRYSSSVVAPTAAQFAAREHRLEQVGGVHRALGGARRRRSCAARRGTG